MSEESESLYAWIPDGTYVVIVGATLEMSTEHGTLVKVTGKPPVRIGKPPVRILDNIGFEVDVSQIPEYVSYAKVRDRLGRMTRFRRRLSRRMMAELPGLRILAMQAILNTLSSQAPGKVARHFSFGDEEGYANE